MDPSGRAPYFFLLRQPAAAVCREAANRLRELGQTVVAQYGRVALEALATPQQAKAASQTGFFAAQLKGVQVIANGNSIYNNQSINRWLEDDDRTWSDNF